MSRKQLMEKLLRQEKKVEDLFIAGVSQADREKMGEVNDWAVKDGIAHYAYFRNIRAADIPRIIQGEEIATIDDFDAFNAKIFAEFCDKSWEEIVSFARESSLAMREQLDALSLEDLELEWRDEQPLWRVIVGNAYTHPLMHISEYYQKKGEMQRAADITGMLGKPMADLDDGPIWQGMVRYNVACSYSLIGKKRQAIEELRRALELRPNLAEWSRQDPELEPLHEEPGFLALFEE